jgi:hypothetical protein
MARAASGRMECFKCKPSDGAAFQYAKSEGARWRSAKADLVLSTSCVAHMKQTDRSPGARPQVSGINVFFASSSFALLRFGLVQMVLDI